MAKPISEGPIPRESPMNRENLSERRSMTRLIRFILTPETTSHDGGHPVPSTIPDSIGRLKAVCWYVLSVVAAIGIAGLH